MAQKAKNLWLLFLGLLGFKSTEVMAQTSSALLCIDGITGNTQSAKNPGCMDVLAWSWGASQAATLHQGTTVQPRSNFQDLAVTKFVDAATEDFMGGVAVGSQFATATLSDFATCADCGIPPEIEIRMSPVIITSHSIGSSGSEQPTENITLNFAKFEYCTTPQDAKGATGPEECFNFDIPNSKAF